MEDWQTYDLTDARLTDRQRRHLELDRVHIPALYAALGIERGRLTGGVPDFGTAADVRARDAAADPHADVRRLVLALDGLDRDWKHTLDAWSHAAAHAAPAHAYLRKVLRSGGGAGDCPPAVRGRLSEERRRLDDFLGAAAGDTPQSKIRGVLLARLAAAGVTFPAPAANGCASELVQAYRSLPGLRAAVRRNPADAWCRERVADHEATLARFGAAA